MCLKLHNLVGNHFAYFLLDNFQKANCDKREQMRGGDGECIRQQRSSSLKEQLAQ